MVIPIDTPGLKLYPRRPYATAGMNSFDYPLSSRFDETDCFCVFDNVFVPWESVYIYRNLQICWDQWWKTPAHLYGNHQAQCRYAVKLRFMLGLAKRMNEMTGNEGHQAVQVEMGELAAIVSIVENMLLAQETVAPIDADGVLWPLTDRALFGDGAAVRAQRPHAGDDPRARRRGDDHAAVLGARPRQSGDGGGHGALHAVGEHAGARARRPDADGVGLSSAPSSATAMRSTRNSTAARRSW